MIGPALLKFATSRVGIVLILISVLFTWHKIDKSSAVRHAVVEYVASVELSAARAKAEVFRERAERLAAANRVFAAASENDEREAIDAERIIQEYLDKNPVPPAVCRVDDGLFGLLRSN